MVVGCVALIAIGTNPAVQSAGATAQAVTAEASAAQLAADEELIVNAEQLIDEPFEDPDAIDITPDEGSTASISDGVYEISLEENNSRSTYLDEPITDFASEVECAVIDGGSNGACGIVFGVNDDGDDENPDEHYFFVSDGKYGMTSVEGGNENSWSKGHSAVKDEEGEMNLLRVVREGPEIRLYINDVLVDRFESTQLPEGGVGFAASAEDGGATVQLDNFRIWQFD
jgi:hypothetical protein